MLNEQTAARTTALEGAVFTVDKMSGEGNSYLTTCHVAALRTPAYHNKRTRYHML